MDIRNWYYASNGQRLGPVSQETIQQMINTGALDSSTLLWTRGLSDWIPVGKVPLFEPVQVASGPPPLPNSLPVPAAPVTTDHSASDTYSGNIAQGETTPYFSEDIVDVTVSERLHPWRRYFARLFDIFVFSIVASIVLALVSPDLLEMNSAAFGFLLLFGMNFVEPVFISQWGTTPGKLLFKIRIVQSSGGLLSYFDALGRSFGVWLGGLAMGFPLINLLTLAGSYSDLKKNGESVWDRKGGFVVRHSQLDPARYILIVVAFVGLFCLFALSQE